MNIKKLSLLTAGAGLALLLSRKASASSSKPKLLLAGTYNGLGNIYSPTIDTLNNKMYFGGWYSNNEYPFDKVYSTDLNNLLNVKTVISYNNGHVNDPSLLGNKIYTTVAPAPPDITDQYIAVSITNDNGNTWSYPRKIIPSAWMPSAIKTDNIYLYYTINSPTSTDVFRATLDNNDNVLQTIPIKFEANLNPINIDIKYYDNIYYLMGDYWEIINNVQLLCIGLWTSIDGINFTKYSQNPIIIPNGDNIVARSATFQKVDNIFKIWYAQQKSDWWTNTIYYNEYNS